MVNDLRFFFQFISPSLYQIFLVFNSVCFVTTCHSAIMQGRLSHMVWNHVLTTKLLLYNIFSLPNLKGTKGKKCPWWFLVFRAPKLSFRSGRMLLEAIDWSVKMIGLGFQIASERCWVQVQLPCPLQLLLVDVVGQRQRCQCKLWWRICQFQTCARTPDCIIAVQ